MEAINKKAFIIEVESLMTFDRKVWIIDRVNPSIPILKIDESDFNLIKSDIFISQNNKILFNGKPFYISVELVDKLKVKAKTNKFNLTNLSFSMREYLDPEIVDNLKPIIDISPLRELRNEIGDTYLIISKYMKDKYRKHIQTLIDKLSEEGFVVRGLYWLEQEFYNFEQDINSYKKGMILLSHLTGRKIQNSIFTEDEFPKYSEIIYYDCNESIIGDIKKIQEMFTKIFKKSSDIDFEQGVIYLNRITNNNLNKLVKYKVEIKKVN